jgi:hypothetical protein
LHRHGNQRLTEIDASWKGAALVDHAAVDHSSNEEGKEAKVSVDHLGRQSVWCEMWSD